MVKRIVWPLSLLIAMAAFGLAVSGRHHFWLVTLLAGCWVVVSLGALILQQFAQRPHVESKD